MNSSNNLINRYYQSSKNIFVICLLVYLFILLLPQDTAADTVSNGNYSIDVGSIDTNPQPTPKPQVLGTNNIKTNDFTTGTNYTVNAPSNKLSLKLSQNIIDYGILSSTNPVIRTSEIFLTENLLGGEIISYENNALRSAANSVIQNTSCDNGVCTPEIAAEWNNTLTYGFGYRCDSTQKYICDSQFSSSTYFKPFADISLEHTPDTVIETGKGNSQATITYKINISGTQKTGGYYNSITYLAIPNF
jgi:hypothetical protein